MLNKQSLNKKAFIKYYYIEVYYILTSLSWMRNINNCFDNFSILCYFRSYKIQTMFFTDEPMI
jgi:hypothetical protein